MMSCVPCCYFEGDRGWERVIMPRGMKLQKKERSPTQQGFLAQLIQQALPGNLNQGGEHSGHVP